MSIGVTAARPEDTVETLMRRADRLMYATSRPDVRRVSDAGVYAATRSPLRRPATPTSAAALTASTPGCCASRSNTDASGMRLVGRTA